ncbi:hypothetical protein NA78x_005072 [Anatilimnocola sp. NA78]|uniref:hypothetical protein n=1 Tax=Anatilimnocola sp. NA78 TaxID=3415683 RepID=UPI003CE48B3E
MSRLLSKLMGCLVLAAAMLPAADLFAQAKAKPRIMDENEPAISKFMRAKLEHSQKLIESLALEDYEKMAKSAQEMSLLTRAEQWQLLQTPDYLYESDSFRRAADELTEAAKAKNLDRAALAYVDMTLKCVKCHKLVRHTKMAALPANSRLPLEALVAPDVRVSKKPMPAEMP